MGSLSAFVGFALIILAVSTSVLATSPPAVDYGKPMPPPCPKNEVRRCQDTCPPDHCITLYAAFDCIANQTCVNGCYCKKGYLRIGREGPCVPQDQCPPVECAEDSNARRGCGEKCGNTCADYNTSPICPKRPCKNDGCDCKEGYVHDTNRNICVLPKDCTKPCKSHERWSPCLMSECVAKTCEDLGKPLACPDVAMDHCPGGCICDYGYVKSKNGSCIDAKTCPSCGGDPKKEAGCGNPCGKTCASLNVNKSEIMCPQYCEVNGCDCKKGYLLDTDTKPPKCVLVKDCPKPPNQCGKNEEYYCGPSCPDSEASCSNPSPPICINKRCELKCFCKKGYVRDNKNDNVCIPADKCPITCSKEHERYIDCYDGQCGPKSCDDLGRSISCPRPRGPCPGGCICEEGYLRDVNGDCIKIGDCHYGTPMPPPCPKNEVRRCQNTCPSDKCITLYAAFICIANQTCVNGCYCKKGYLRIGSKGPCVPKDQCPPVDCVEDSNARRGCGDKCGKTCADYNTSPICPKRPCKNDGCDCKEGYVHDTNQDRCVLPKDCTPNQCGKNEEYYCGPSCPDSEASCSNPSPPICINKRCELKCFCKKGYVRDNQNGNVCIPADKCPITCTKEHERYTDCYDGQCGPKSCDDLGKSISCPRPRGPCPGGCICEEGYLRDVNGDCIKIGDCPPKPCSGNQTWMSPCDTPCPMPRCPRDDKPSPPCVEIKPCYPGCQCKLNYLRNKKGKCILASECPSVNCTRQNEKYCNCPSACLAEGCDDVNNQPTTCNTLIWLCSPRCVCKKGYFRNKDGLCIPASQCLLYCKDPNASWRSCQDICPGTCQNPKPICMSKMACRPGCQCKKGYVLDKPGKGGKCIKIQKCPAITTTVPPTTAVTTPAPPKCKTNEHWTECYVGDCRPKTCYELVRPAPCPRIIPPCPGGCICNIGYVRDSNGKCIRKRDCPKICKGQNEQYTDCIQGQCSPTTCKEVVKMPYCPTAEPGECREGCKCENGFVRSDNGTCISISDCPEAGKCTEPNQAWTQCTANCANAYCPKDDQRQPNCFLPVGSCHPGCKCKPNYRISKDNKCIPARHCPAVPCTRQHEEYNPCPGSRITSCALLGTTPDTSTGTIICNPGCICKKGFYTNDNGTCVPRCECPPNTPSS